MKRTPTLISIEGNIGSGKSTLLKTLKRRNPSWHVVDEPVDSWLELKNERGESLLEVFYKDKRRWSYTFQNTALLTRILALRRALKEWEEAECPGSPIFIMERCTETDANVFARLLAEDGDMDGLESTLYTMWFDAFKDQVPAPVGYIHVDTPVTICHERIGQRARNGEGGGAIPIEYLDRLDSAHYRWLREPAFGTPVLRVDNVSKEATPIQDVERWVEQQWLRSVD